jgi:hypothetical protein
MKTKELQKVELSLQEIWMHTKTIVYSNKKKYNRKKEKRKFKSYLES